MILDVNNPEKHRIVNIGNALSPLAQRRPEQRRSVMQMYAVHVGAEKVGETIVGGRIRVEGTEGEVGDVFVDLLGDEGDVEEELWTRRAGGGVGRRRGESVSRKEEKSGEKTETRSEDCWDVPRRLLP